MQTYENFLKKQSGGLGMLEGVAHLAHLKHLFCSDLDQKRAVFWSKSEMKHLKHPETLGTPETLCVDVGIAVL